MSVNWSKEYVNGELTRLHSLRKSQAAIARDNDKDHFAKQHDLLADEVDRDRRIVLNAFAIIQAICERNLVRDVPQFERNLDTNDKFSPTWPVRDKLLSLTETPEGMGFTYPGSAQVTQALITEKIISGSASEVTRLRHRADQACRRAKYLFYKEATQKGEEQMVKEDPRIGECLAFLRLIPEYKGKSYAEEIAIIARLKPDGIAVPYPQCGHDAAKGSRVVYHGGFVPRTQLTKETTTALTNTEDKPTNVVVYEAPVGTNGHGTNGSSAPHGRGQLRELYFTPSPTSPSSNDGFIEKEISSPPVKPVNKLLFPEKKRVVDYKISASGLCLLALGACEIKPDDFRRIGCVMPDISIFRDIIEKNRSDINWDTALTSLQDAVVVLRASHSDAFNKAIDANPKPEFVKVFKYFQGLRVEIVFIEALRKMYGLAIKQIPVTVATP